MTWKETVFTEEDGALQPEFMKEQARRSFEAGIREVVDYLTSFIQIRYRMVSRSEADSAVNTVLRDLEAKLKEWGVEREKEL